MYKKFLVFAFVFSMFVDARQGIYKKSSDDGQSVVFHGRTVLEKATYEDIAVHGNSQLKKITANTLTTHGKCIGKDLRLVNLYTHGNSLFEDINAKNVEMHGHSQVEDSDIDTMVSHGMTQLEDVDIAYALTCHGRLVLHDCTIHTLITVGNCELYNTSITHATEITTQYMVVENSTIKNGITFHIPSGNSNMSIRNWLCSFNFVKSVFSDACVAKKEELILKGKTIIHGDIVFESGNGKVIADASVVLKGKIIGGELIQR